MKYQNRNSIRDTKEICGEHFQDNFNYAPYMDSLEASSHTTAKALLMIHTIVL